MALKPELSFGASIAVMAMDYGIFQLNMPSTADVKASAPHSQPIDSSRKAATWTSIAMCGALSLLAREPNIFIFGGGFAVVLDYYYRHANAVSPLTGMVVMPSGGSAGPGSPYGQ